MAETLYLLDGSSEVVIGDPNDYLRRIIREHLGRDCENLYIEIIAEFEEEIRSKKEFVKDFKSNAEGYLVVCQDTVDGIEECLKLIDAQGKLNTKLLRSKLESIKRKIRIEL